MLVLLVPPAGWRSRKPGGLNSTGGSNGPYDIYPFFPRGGGVWVGGGVRFPQVHRARGGPPEGGGGNLRGVDGWGGLGRVFSFPLLISWWVWGVATCWGFFGVKDPR